MEDSNKKSKKSKKGVVIFIVLIVILVLILVGFWISYICRFSGGLSSDQSIWAEFGDYFNGVVSPIFAAINICIFWYLTVVIDDNNDIRRQQDAEHQKAMILMQFRKNEVDRLNEVLQVSKEDKNNSDFALLLIHSKLTIDVFLKSKLVFFGLEKESEIAKNLNALSQELSEISKAYMEFLSLRYLIDYMSNNTLNDNCEVDKNEPDPKNRNEGPYDISSNYQKYYNEMNNHIKTAIELKTSIINDLYKITLGEKIS